MLGSRWLLICESVKSLSLRVVTLVLRAPGLRLVTAVHFARALGSSGKRPVTPADGPMPGDHSPLPGSRWCPADLRPVAKEHGLPGRHCSA